MKKPIFFLSIIILLIQSSSFAQQLNDSLFNIFKTKIEASDFPPYQTTKMKFNRTNYSVNTNASMDTLIIERIKVVENGYSDPSNDKEIRSVAFKDIDFKATTVVPGEDYYFFEIYTKNKENLVTYELIRNEESKFVVNNKIGIGRFSKAKVKEKQMQELVDLFTKIYN